ncbi:MAG: hypothetical protein LC721_06260, partial [Actinobacteria bacterium]|nr:hypothetical protein [Actinomycetota bacterium]
AQNRDRKHCRWAGLTPIPPPGGTNRSYHTTPSYPVFAPPTASCVSAAATGRGAVQHCDQWAING